MDILIHVHTVGKARLSKETRDAFRRRTRSVTRSKYSAEQVKEIRLRALNGVSDSNEKELLRAAIEEEYRLSLPCQECDINLKNRNGVCNRHFHDYCCPCSNPLCLSCLVADESSYW